MRWGCDACLGTGLGFRVGNYFLVSWFCGKSSVDGNLIRETYARGGWVDNVVFWLHRGQ